MNRFCAMMPTKRRKLLATLCATSALYLTTFPTAQAFNNQAPDTQPSIELNLDVLDNLPAAPGNTATGNANAKQGLVWQEGPKGQIVELPPETPKPKKPAKKPVQEGKAIHKEAKKEKHKKPSDLAAKTKAVPPSPHAAIAKSKPAAVKSKEPDLAQAPTPAKKPVIAKPPAPPVQPPAPPLAAATPAPKSPPPPIVPQKPVASVAPPVPSPVLSPPALPALPPAPAPKSPQPVVPQKPTVDLTPPASSAPPLPAIQIPLPASATPEVKLPPPPVTAQKPVIDLAPPAEKIQPPSGVPTPAPVDLTVPPLLSAPTKPNAQSPVGLNGKSTSANANLSAMPNPIEQTPPAPATAPKTSTDIATTLPTLPALPALGSSSPPLSPPIQATAPQPHASTQHAPTLPLLALPSRAPGNEAPLPPAPVTPKSPPKPAAPVEAAKPPLAEAPGAKEEHAAPLSSKADMQVVFNSTETSLPLSVKDDLAALAKKLKSNDTSHITLTAYAAGTGDQGPSTARRISLSRALAVRAYLIDQGVSSLRINVQAEGSKNPGGEPDRVDLFINGATNK